MPTFSAFDGTLLSYRTIGEGEPLVCLPGGPFQDSVYLGDLGGLARHRQLILLDLRGTGGSAVPDDPSSYRCDRLVDDVEALRAELGLTTMDLLSHSAGVNLAVLYAARHPGNVRRLVLVGPSVFGVGITVTGETRRAVAQLRKDEPWYPAAWAALDAITSGNAGDDDWAAIAPFGYGRWDEAAQRHQAAGDAQTNQEAAAIFASDGAFDPAATRAALATLSAPVLLVAGEYDLNSPASSAAEYAELFLDGRLVVQAGAGHLPWLDDPEAFTRTVTAFLR